MKNLTTDQQIELRELMNSLLSDDRNLNAEQRAQVAFWELELRPKRIRRKQNLLDTEEGVVEQAYAEHTGMIFTNNS